MTNKKERKNINGWLIIDKPTGMSSAKVVGRVKYLTQAKKAGHAGTLDPLASGVLPIALGEATKTAGYATNADKAYSFTISFGSSTDTYDAEGEVTAHSDALPDEEAIKSVLQELTGNISQIPPAFSAIKVDGKRAYALARKGENVTLLPRNITIYSLSLLTMPSESTACFEVHCSKGTYVRSLMRDICAKLGVEGHISALRRITCGKFSEKDTISLEKLETLLYDARLAEALAPVESVLDDIPVLELDTDQATRLKNGQPVITAQDHVQNCDPACVTSDGKLVAIGQLAGGIFRPSRVFNH